MRADDSRLEAAATPGKAAGRQDLADGGTCCWADAPGCADRRRPHLSQPSGTPDTARWSGAAPFRMGIPAAPSRSGLTKGGEQTHVQAATAEIFLDPAVARFPRSLAAVPPLEGGGLFSPASHQPRRRARVSARVVTIVAALASSSLASSRRRFSASSPTTCSANRSAALLVSATRSASGRDG